MSNGQDTTFAGRANTWAELCKNTLTALAILVGAVWALFKFDAFEAPFLDATVATRLSVKVAPHPKDPSICIANIELGFENVSSVSLRIEKVHLKMWFYQRSSVNSETLTQPALIDNFSAFDTEPAWQLPEAAQVPFLHKYDPRQSFTYTYRLAFHAPKNSNVIFRVQVEGDSGQGETLSEIGRTASRNLDACNRAK